MAVAPHRPGQVPTLVLRWIGSLRVVTAAEVAEGCGLDLRQATRGIESLRKRGLLKRHRTALGQVRLTFAGMEAARMERTIHPGPLGPTGPKPRRAEGFRDRAWRSMRLRRLFTAAEVATDAARDEADPQRAARAYLVQLVAGGVVAELKARVPGAAPGSNGHKRYRLLRDLGPLAPRWDAAAGVLRDRNPVRKGPASG